MQVNLPADVQVPYLYAVLTNTGGIEQDVGGGDVGQWTVLPRKYSLTPSGSEMIVDDGQVLRLRCLSFSLFAFLN